MEPTPRDSDQIGLRYGLAFKLFKTPLSDPKIQKKLQPTP